MRVKRRRKQKPENNNGAEQEQTTTGESHTMRGHDMNTGGD